jgi:hypothetical protein
MASLAFGAGEASAWGYWFFDPIIYPPMHAPPLDPRRGPVWTPNGWSYPQWGEVPPVPVPYGVPGPWIPGVPPVPPPIYGDRGSGLK